MTRKTYGGDIHVDSNRPDFPEEWGNHEMVLARTRMTQGDRKWINAHASSSMLDQNAPDGMRVEMDTVEVQTALVARMVKHWTLTRDLLDQNGEPVLNDHGRPKQVPIPLSPNPEERIAILNEMNAEDVAYLANCIMQGAPPPMTKEAQDAFFVSASAPSSTN